MAHASCRRPPPRSRRRRQPVAASAAATFTIGELAREFGLTTRAIRFYEDFGLLAPARAGRNRIYTARDRARLTLTLRGKRLGLKLAEVKELVDMYEGQRDSQAQLRRFVDVLARQRAQLEARLADLRTDPRRGAGAGSGGAARPAGAKQMTATAPAFPAALTDSRAFAIARAMLDGFDRHYRLFRQASAEAKARFEAADWHGQQQAQAQRIAYYERRVAEATERLQNEFQAATLPMEVWQQVKLHYIGLLINHYQPELRRDLLQLGDDQDPAPQLLPQRLHLRPLRGLDRPPRERRAGGAADLSRLLPDQGRRWSRPGTASSPTSSSRPSSRTSAATSPT